MTAENIAYGYGSPAAVVDGWMHSEGHRRNILTGGLVHVGMGASAGSWVQLFLTGGCSFSSLEVLPGAQGLTLPVGGAVDDLGAAVCLHCSAHGDCYLPLTAEMCSGADTSHEGTASVTVSCNGATGSFTLEVSGSAAPAAAELMLVLNPDGGTLPVGSSNQLTVKNGQPYGELPTPTREGYRFEGWYDAAGNVVTAITAVTATEAHTLTARWTKQEETPTAATVEFTDVAPGAYYYDAVAWAVEKGVTNGTGNGRFSPDMTLTRAMAVTFLWRAVGSPAPHSSYNPFSDVKAGWYYDAVLWAVENGITNGMGNGVFGVDEDVTRGQMLTFLWRTEGKPNDIGGAWYAAAENWANSNGLLYGTAQSYSTNAKCPRADVVYYLYRDMAD